MPIAAAKPLIEKIVEVILYRLRLLTAGYSDNTAVCEVIRPLRLGGFTPKHLQILLTQNPAERVEDIDYPGNPPALGYSMQFNIRCHVLPSESDTTPVDELANIFAADVQRVMCDTSVELEDFQAIQWHTLRDQAIISRWLSHEAIEPSGGVGGVTVPLEVTYRVAENDPYVRR